MRMARSISPWRRNRLPSAKCRSMVWGSTFTTSMNDSIALSGCSFNRKLRPRKYDSGRARDSRNRCEMSMRAAIQPSAKNSTGIRSSHHSRSKSIIASAAVDRSSRRCSRAAPLLPAQATELALHAHVAHEPREEPCPHAQRKRDQEQKDQRRFPREPVVEAHGDELGVLQREKQQRQEDRESHHPADDRHRVNPKEKGSFIVP